MAHLLKTSVKVIVLLPLLMVCCYYTVDQSVKIMETYTNNPYSSLVQFVSTGKIKFPNVRICPTNWVDRLKQQQLNISDQFLEYLLEFLIDNLLVRRDYSTSESLKLFMEFQDFGKQHPDLEYPFGIVDFLMLRCEMLLENCMWKGQSFSCCDSRLVPRIYTNIGPCFLFRVDRFADSYQYREGPVDGLQFTITEPTSKERSTTYKFNKLPLESGIVSIMKNFRPWTKQPQVVPSKSSTFIGISMVETRKSHDCSNEASAHPLLPSSHSRSSCLYGCFVNEIFRNCECYPSGIGRVVIPNKTKVCNPWDYSTCFPSQVYPNLSRIIVFCDENTKKMCPKRCVNVEYSPSTGAAPLPKNQIFGKHESENVTFRRSNVYVYFTSIGKTVTQEVRTQTPYTILSNFGGLLGLWLGLSIFGLGKSTTELVVVPLVEKVSVLMIKETNVELFGKK